MKQGRVRIDSDAAARIGAGFVQVSQQRARLRAAALLCITVLALLIFFCKSVNPTRREANPSAFVNALDAPSAAEHFNRSAAMHNRMAIGVLAASMSSAALADAVQWRVEDGGNGHWYEAVRYATALTHAQAIDAAVAAGGALASIGTAAELQAFESRAVAYGGGIGFHLGGFQPVGGPGYSEPSGGWRWEDGTVWSFTNWDCGICGWWCQPDNYVDQNYLVGLNCNNRFVWDDGHITNVELGAIYEYSADCNNDGIVDYGQLLAGNLADHNGNNTPDVCEAGFADGVLTGVAPVGVPLRTLDSAEGLTVGIKRDGSLVSWVESGSDIVAPVGSYTAVAVGRSCAIAIRNDGTLAPFGVNLYGRLDVPGGAFVAVDTADATWHSAAVRPDGTLLCWGYNNNGQCNVPAGSYRAVATGGHEVWSGFTTAIRNNGSIAAWGNNTWGQTNVPAGTNFRTIDAGYYHALALRTDNTIAGWGFNSNGQSTAPIGQFLAVAAASTESVALRADGTVLAWGYIPQQMADFCAALTDCTEIDIRCCGHIAVLRSVDCDANGSFDAVEIAANQNADADINGVLDVCESCPYLVPSACFATIQSAIDAAPTAELTTINVLAGTYHEAFALLGKNVIIRGAADNATILDGTGLTASIALFSGGEPATAGVERLVFRNGTTGSRFTPKSNFTIGGAIYANSSSAHISDCRFENCRADYGGAIYHYVGGLAWDNCVFINNIANDDGGAALVYNVTGSVRECDFTGNRCGMFGAGSGSAFKAVGSNGDGEAVVLDSCTITNNFALDSGSAVEFYEHAKYHPGVLHIVNTTISGNSSGKPVPDGAAGLRVLHRMQSCILSAGTNICNNTPKNVDGPYFIEGSVTVCECHGDFFADGIVNAADLGILLSNWGLTNPNGAGDANHDGLVNAIDVSVLLANWGVCPN